MINKKVGSKVTASPEVLKQLLRELRELIKLTREKLPKTKRKRGPNSLGKVKRVPRKFKEALKPIP